MTTGAPAPYRAGAPAPYRAEVHRLAGQGHSGRAIARQLDIPETTVRRWLSAARTAPTTAHAAPCNTTATHTAPHKARNVEALSLPLHPDLSDDLAVLAGAGLGEDAAAATAAVRLLADAYRAAWEYGDLPYGAPGRVQITTRITTHG